MNKGQAPSCASHCFPTFAPFFHFNTSTFSHIPPSYPMMSNSNNPTISTSSNSKSARDRSFTVGLKTGYLDSNGPESAHTSQSGKPPSCQSSSHPGNSPSDGSDLHPDPPGGSFIDLDYHSRKNLPVTLNDTIAQSPTMTEGGQRSATENPTNVGDEMDIDPPRKKDVRPPGSVDFWFDGVNIGWMPPSDILETLQSQISARASRKSSRQSSGIQKSGPASGSGVTKPVRASNSRRGKGNVSQAASSQRRSASEEAMDDIISGDEVDKLKKGVEGMSIGQ